MIRRSYLYCFIGIFIFSTYEVAGKMVGNTVPPVMLTSLRFLIGALILIPFAFVQYRRKRIAITGKDFLTLSVPGILNVTISMLLLQLSINYGKAALAALLVSSNPVFVALFAWLILKEQVSCARGIGMLVGVIGVTTVILGEPGILTGSSNMGLGILFGLLASITFALYTVISKPSVQRFGNFVFNVISFTIGALVLLVCGMILHVDLHFSFTSTNILGTLYLGIFITGIGYFLFFEGLQHVPAAKGSMFFYLKPVFATILAYVLLQEKISTIQMLGFFIVIVGLQFEPIMNRLSRSSSKKSLS